MIVGDVEIIIKMLNKQKNPFSQANIFFQYRVTVCDYTNPPLSLSV